jgi:hypothetical protein
VEASSENVENAVQHVEQLEAAGKTNITDPRKTESSIGGCSTNGVFSSLMGIQLLVLLTHKKLPQFNQQHKTKQNNLVGVVLLSVNNPPHHHTTTTTPPHRNDYMLSHFQAT